MSSPDPHAFPLAWPASRPRTPAADRRSSAFSRKEVTSLGTRSGRLTREDAIERLEYELWQLAIHPQDYILSSNVELRRDGYPRADRREPDDPGVAVYFPLDGRDTVFACDRWDIVADNIAAIAKHIEALRGMDRWGVGTREQAFAGYQALPPPGPGDRADEDWWQLLGVPRDANLAEIDLAWRRKMRIAHPDAGGDAALAARLNRARDEGRKANA